MTGVRAPGLFGRGGWIGADTDVAASGLEALRGRVVVLVFFSASNVGSARVLKELAAELTAFPVEAVLVAVHSPKLPHEKEHDVVVEAVDRLRVAGPVVDDPDLWTWHAYGAKAWPTTIVIDPVGEVVGAVTGEGCGPAVAAAVRSVVDAHRAAGTLEPKAPPFVLPRFSFGTLHHPRGVAVSVDGSRLAVADTGHDRVVVTDADGGIRQTVVGLTAPEAVAFDEDRDALLICDTGADRVVRIARMEGEADASDAEVVLDGVASPSAVARHAGAAYVAETGRHRLWRLDPDGSVLVAAGDGGLGLEDGPALDVPMAQPSGLGRAPQGMLVVDADSSSLRVLTDAGDLVTLVGRGLHAWGAEDGPASTARFEGPLAVVAAPDGMSAYVADAGNGSIRLWSGVDGEVRTVPTPKLARPCGLALLPDGRLLVAEGDAHRLVVLDVAAGTVEPLDVHELAPEGFVARGTRFDLPYALELGDPGASALDDGDGPPVRVTVEAEPGWLLGPGPRAWALHSSAGTIQLAAGPTPGAGTVHVRVRASVCDDDSCSEVESESEHPLVVG